MAKSSFNRLFVAYKPPHISSNRFLGKLKRFYGVKKAGFSGTLDPFACGCLIVAFGSYTKLFNYIEKTPKRYRATIWLGASSDSLDLENIHTITQINPLRTAIVQKSIENLQGELTYTAPKFSAKKIRGKRAYELARSGDSFTPPTLHAKIYDAVFLHYNHPFVTFEVSVSEGTYIRSLCEYLAKQWEVAATLSYLERLSEGKFSYNGQKALDPLEYTDLLPNDYDDLEAVTLGKKLQYEKLHIQKDGVFYIDLQEYFSIIEVKDGAIKYLKNRIEKC